MATTKTLPEWEDQAFSKIFAASLKKTDNPNILHLESLINELKEENFSEPFQFESLHLDRALVSILNDTIKDSTATKYLSECWNRANFIKSNLITRGATNLQKEVLDVRVASLDSAMHLIVSYLGLSLMYPDMFISAEGSAVWLSQQLLEENESTFPSSLLDSIVSRFEGDGLEQIVSSIMSAVNASLVSITVSKSYTPYIKLVARLVENRTIAIALTQASEWKPEEPVTDPASLEYTILLGPLLLLSTFPDAKNLVHQDYFMDSSGNFSMAGLTSTFHTLRSTNSNILSSLFNIFDKIVRASPDARNAFLKLVSIILVANDKRAGLQVDLTKVSSSRFLISLNRILLRFVDPLIDIRYTKINRIEMDYFRQSELLAFPDEARLGSTQEAYKAYLEGKNTMQSGTSFVSDIFHLNVTACHFGILQAMDAHTRSDRALQEEEERLNQFEGGRSTWIQGTASRYDMMLTRFKAKLQVDKALHYARAAYVMDPILLENVSRFYGFVIAYLMRLLDSSHSHPKTPIRLPAFDSNESAPLQLIMLPEYYVSDIVEFFSFIAKWQLEKKVYLPMDDIVAFVTAFLTHGEVISNPHLKIQMVELLGLLAHSTQSNPEGVIAPYLNNVPLALSHLLPALLRFYVNVEHTGLSSQFHDKFNVRYHICRLLRILWKSPIHQEKMRMLSKDMDFFVKFVNLLMNDTTYLLDESLTKLAEIHTIQMEKNDKEQWDAHTPEHRAEREQLLESDARQAKMYVALSNENVNLLMCMTESLPAPFLSSEIVTRLAAMLNYTLAALAGPRCAQLKVQDPESYQFRPRALLTEIVTIYLHLDSPEFVRGVASDGRSYKISLFQRTYSIINKFNLLDSSRLKEFMDLSSRTEMCHQETSQAEEDLGEIPDEFLDPVMYTLMTEPVTLPTSGVTVDLSTIKAHLLSDNKDPFNRQPLELSQCVPNVELKQRVQEFLDQTRSKKQL